MSEPQDAGEDPTSFRHGRYLYCVVDTAENDAAISTTGIEGGDPYVVECGDLGAVVQSCGSPYDSSDAEVVKGWLLRHQSVVDDVGAAFGTPLPFRFDTILKGDDVRVYDWLEEEREVLSDRLEDLSGLWEYRIEVVRDESELEHRIESEDGRLAELREKCEAASDGTEFMLQRQYERRLRELAAGRIQDRDSSLSDDLRDPAAEVRELDRNVSLLEEGGFANEDERRTTFAVLAPENREEAIGERLDERAARPGVEVRFTGPWPPYSFVPALGRES